MLKEHKKIQYLTTIRDKKVDIQFKDFCEDIRLSALCRTDLSSLLSSSNHTHPINADFQQLINERLIEEYRMNFNPSSGDVN